jgi:hypothetical protein
MAPSGVLPIEFIGASTLIFGIFNRTGMPTFVFVDTETAGATWATNGMEPLAAGRCKINDGESTRDTRINKNTKRSTIFEALLRAGMVSIS